MGVYSADFSFMTVMWLQNLNYSCLVWPKINLKSPSSLAGFEPANLGSSGKHTITTPLRVTCSNYIRGHFMVHKYFFNVHRLVTGQWERL
jgi:hypothetical protein